MVLVVVRIIGGRPPGLPAFAIAFRDDDDTDEPFFPLLFLLGSRFSFFTVVVGADEEEAGEVLLL